LWARRQPEKVKNSGQTSWAPEGYVAAPKNAMQIGIFPYVLQALEGALSTPSSTIVGQLWQFVADCGRMKRELRG
jgi:folate-dependent tRNA-U54 methylase TrmFO/GidA